jgi:lysophospholipase L1-like esterase
MIRALLFSILMLMAFSTRAEETGATPTLWIIGDSTVNNSGNGMCGWGNVINSHFDESKLKIVNRARGGRSSRTFFNEGLWDAVAKEVKPGDFVLIQFGHNDGGPLEGDPKGRRSLPGTGEETREVNKPNSQEKEIVHTFGWYMRHFTRDAMSKGATVVLLSPIPRDNWKDGKVLRSTESFTKWDAEIASQEKALFVDLNDLISAKYEAMGPDAVKKFFTSSERDRTHTSQEGAEFNAGVVVEGIKSLEACKLKDFVK